MVTALEVQRQLKALGVEITFWGRAEMRELQHILIPEEQITHCVMGRYEGGFALLCATDRRLLLIDKKPFYLTLEDLRYDMISEVDFSHRLLDATVNIHTVNKILKFTSMRNGHLRKLTAYLQDRVMTVRQQHLVPVQQPQTTSQFLQQPSMTDAGGVTQLQYQATNPYTRVPLLMRRRVSRFYTPNN